MSGALTLMLGEGNAGGGPGGTLGALAWNNIYGPPGTRFATTNTLTISGISGALTLEMALSSHGRGGPILNGVAPSSWPAGPWTVVVHNGDMLAWAVINDFLGGAISGTVTITRTDTGATVDTFTYFVQF